MVDGRSAILINEPERAAARDASHVNDRHRDQSARDAVAAMESWFSTLKSELGEPFESYGLAKKRLFDYVSAFNPVEVGSCRWRSKRCAAASWPLPERFVGLLLVRRAARRFATARTSILVVQRETFRYLARPRRSIFKLRKIRGLDEKD